MQTDEDKQAFKRAYIEARGYWAPFNEGLLEHSPEWLEAYLAYSSTPARVGPLSARMRELIYVAVDGSTTHLFQAGLEIHVRIALDAGCTPGELIEVLQIATMQGLDSVELGLTVLQEELNSSRHPYLRHSRESGSPSSEPSVDAAAQQSRTVPQDCAADASSESRQAPEMDSRFRGNDEDYGAKAAPAWRTLMLQLSPDWIAALDSLLATADRTSKLTAQERALIRLALAASPTHLNARAVRTEVRAALNLGATPEEIAQVFQLVAHLGLHACSEGVPAVVRAAAERAA